jgi:hypothetical protein
MQPNPRALRVRRYCKASGGMGYWLEILDELGGETGWPGGTENLA